MVKKKKSSGIKSETVPLKMNQIKQSTNQSIIIPSRTSSILYVHPALVTPGGMVTLLVMYYQSQ